MSSSEHSYADALVASQKVHTRKPADFYPTPHNVTAALMDFLKLAPGTTAWECACGSGDMAMVLEYYLGHDGVWASDLREDCGYGDAGVNFMTCEVNVQRDWIISNPPFNLAAAFIERALSITPNVAFLLKSQYWHAKTRRKLFDRHPPAFILPLTWRPAFLEKERGKSPLMDVMWVVWMPHDGETKYQPIDKPEPEFLNSRFHFESDTDIGLNSCNGKMTEVHRKLNDAEKCRFDFNLLDILGVEKVTAPVRSVSGNDLTDLLN
ncbi:hypothetical protein BPNPMPFG_002501 [Mesorhizobium sp. AR07]|uniref:hypothetical protein n=1 Tax=Mesorhizobium sp. AR07 TaxID=2865838 RepID=UPI00215E4509|nr:hypothetical protein [Mesorhizobium sp. AR07]UVK46791.1 hypothetical protein BPNPMPFG_002501 [Mesorhizobium sp. AR07]